MQEDNSILDSEQKERLTSESSSTSSISNNDGYFDPPLLTYSSNDTSLLLQSKMSGKPQRRGKMMRSHVFERNERMSGQIEDQFIEANPYVNSAGWRLGTA